MAARLRQSSQLATKCRMHTSTAVSTPEARYISVDEVEYEPANGFAKTLRKHLLTTDRVQIHQTLIRGRGEAEGYGLSTANRAAYVLAGSAILKHAAPTEPGDPRGVGSFARSEARRVGRER